jgi:hypothetical protein
VSQRPEAAGAVVLLGPTAFALGALFEAEGRVKEHLDLRGVSGAVYRFQLIGDDSKVPAEGGNYVYARIVDNAFSLVYCGVTDTLHDAKQNWSKAADEYGANALFVRRNITRSQREREHIDIVAETPPLMGDSL